LFRNPLLFLVVYIISSRQCWKTYT